MSSHVCSPPGHLNMDENVSSEDDLGSFEDSEIDSDDELDVLRPCVRSLGLSKSYVFGWTCQDAFRELYQNWKDAIVASFNLNPRSFKLEVKDTSNQIQILAKRHHPSERGRAQEELLGFIRYNKKAGSLELSNFKARLGPQHLSLGGTSKRGEDRFVGVHGEGFKLAALVLCRNGRAVRFQASSHYWNFCFRGVHSWNFYCRISRPKIEVLEKKKEKFRQKSEAGIRKGLNANMWEDVAVKITKGRGESGKPISEAEFRSWFDVSIDIDGPQSVNIIETDYGDLILDTKFQGRIYLKGLLIPGDLPDQKRYYFGYNFVQGRINRDRERLMDQEEESRMLAMIWEQSIISRGDAITAKYLWLLSHLQNFPDISMAEEKVSITTAKTLWKYLRTNGPGRFYYYVPESSNPRKLDQENIIINSLKMKPLPVSLVLWNILRKYSLARSPQEQRIFLFANSQPVKINEGMFSIGVQRALRAALLLEPTLEDVKIQFVDGGGSEIDLLFKEEEKTLLIHEKWTDFKTIHRQTFSCEVFRLSQERSGEDLAFLCDHIVEDLVELALNDIQRPLQLGQSRCWELRREVRERIQHTPQLIKVSQTGRSNELEVSWTSNKSRLISKTFGANIRYYVILHRVSTCRSKGDNLLHKTCSLEIGSGVSDCGCTHQVVTDFVKKAIFERLIEGEEYFPMVSRLENNSFFGLPPAPVTSKKASTPCVTARENLRAQADPSVIINDDDDGVCPPEDTETSQKVRENGEGALNNTTIRQQKPTSSEHTRKVLTNTRKSELLAWKADEKTWQVWHEQKLPGIFAQWAHRNKANPMQTVSTVSSLFCEHLDYTFEKNEFARVCIDSERTTNYVIRVHDIRFTDSDSTDQSYELLATKYSLLQSTLFFNSQHSDTSHESDISDQEYFLHFEDFDTMGKAADAEVIRIEDIISASDGSIEHMLRPPQDVMESGLFCRFGICIAEGGKSTCITPLSSSLLQHKDRWRRVNFVYPPNPLLFDLTPNILGSSEGFSRAGYSIHSAIGFDPELHLTWKMRYPASEVYDGPALQVLDDFQTGTLEPISPPSPSTAKVAIVAGENTPFRLSDKNIRLPSRQQFLMPLDIMDVAAKSSLKPDFLVLLMSPAMLHSSTIDRFSATMLKLLEQRLSVHLNLSSLKDYGILQDRSILTLVASPVCASLLWQPENPINGSLPSPKVEALIRDLAFVNPRVNQRHHSGFVCNIPTNSNTSEENTPPEALYNHQTGQSVPPELELVHLDVDAIPLSGYSTKVLVNPKRKDVLTVRELARLQGFEDRFVFYNSLKSQYRDVFNAIPPIITENIAKAIFRIIQSFRTVRLPNPREGQRANKRARVEATELGVNGVDPR